MGGVLYRNNWGSLKRNDWCTFTEISTNKADTIYNEIMQREGLTRIEAKQRYNMMLNLWKPEDVIRKKIYYFGPYYEPKVAEKIATKSSYLGDVYNMFTAIEKEVIESLKNNLVKINQFEESFYPQFYVRRHDSLIVFASPKILTRLKKNVDKLFKDGLYFDDNVDFLTGTERVQHNFHLHTDLYLRQ
jgi:hypothetical protein